MNLTDLYQKIIHQAPMGYACHRIICNEAGVPVDYEFIEVNPAFEGFTGISTEAVTGRRISEVLPAVLTDSFDWVGFYGKVALGGEPERFEQYSESLDHWYSVNVFSPEPGYFVTLFSDISAIKSGARELEISEKRYRAVVDTAPVCVLVADMETMMITHANPLIEVMFGYSAEEALGMSVLALHPESQHPLVLKEFEAIVQGSSTQTVDLPCIRKDGTTFYVTISAVCTDIDGRSSVVGFVRDITDRRLIEDAVKAERDIFIGGPIVVFQWQYGTTWELEYVSRNAEKVLGYTPAYFLEESGRYSALIHPEDIQVFRDRFDSLENSEMAFTELEYRLKFADDIYRWVYYYAVPRRGSDGAISQYQGYLMDMTEIYNVREALNRQLDNERLISEVSGSLVSLSPGNLVEKVNKVLERIGLFYKADRSYIFQLTTDGQTISNTFEWCGVGVEPQKPMLQNVQIVHYPWWSRQLLHGRIISISDASMLPDEATPERLFFLSTGINAVLCLPMMRNEVCMGFIGFDVVKGPRDWTAEEISTLSILNNIISDALNRFMSDQEILHLSYHDKLTGLYNRRFFEEELKRLDTPRQLPLSVIIGDVNGLKITNDVFGHLVGDKLLMAIAGIFTESCREGDVIARWGGDEFVILLPQTPPATVGEICRRIQLGASQEMDLPVQVSVSLGYATKTHENQLMEQVLNSAEDWMYRRKLMESRSFRSAMVKSLISTLAEKSFETIGHTERMGGLSALIGRGMGLSDEELETLNLLAMIHDIGKVAISEEILTKPGPLNGEEWAEVRRHSEIGYRIAQSTAELGQMADLILGHHERWDGAGYPNGLAGESIPKLSRIVAVVDAYDVMTHSRPYREAVTPQEALAEIRRCAGTQFDPRVVAALEKALQV